MPRIKERCRCRHRRVPPVTTYPPSDDVDYNDYDDDDDIDLDDDEVAELLAKEARRRAAATGCQCQVPGQASRASGRR